MVDSWYIILEDVLALLQERQRLATENVYSK